MSLIYTISYAHTDDGICNQLSVEWINGKYLASVAAVAVAEAVTDVFCTVSVAEPVIVQEKPAQRFRRDTFWRFADQMRDRWISGEFQD